MEIRNIQEPPCNPSVVEKALCRTEISPGGVPPLISFCACKIAANQRSVCVKQWCVRYFSSSTRCRGEWGRKKTSISTENFSIPRIRVNLTLRHDVKISYSNFISYKISAKQRTKSTCIRVLASSTGEHIMHARARAMEPAAKGAYGLRFNMWSSEYAPMDSRRKS